MRVIIAGSRGVTDPAIIAQAVADAVEIWSEDGTVEITRVVSGCAPGVDRLGERWAKQRDIPVFFMPADWSKGRQSGVIRNIEMTKHADALVAVWDGVSPGTRHMISAAKLAGLKVHVHLVKDHRQKELAL